MFLAVDLGSAVNSTIENGIDIIRNGGFAASQLDIAAMTLIAQLVATTVLLLVVRFKFWHIVTNIIETRRNKVAEQIEAGKNAEANIELAKAQANDEILNAKEEAKRIINQAKANSQKEKEKMIEEAKEKIEAEKNKAQLELEQNEKELRNNLKQEIIDVAYMLADKMVGEHIDEQKNKEIVDRFLNDDGNNHA